MDNNPKENTEHQTGERRLASTWCLWEKYQEAYISNPANYDKNLHVIFTFSTLERFAMLWKYTTYKNPSELFYDLQYQISKKFKIDETEIEDKTVDGLLLFKKNIEPKWEDPANQMGCSIYCDLYHLSKNCIDKLWKDLIFALVGEQLPHSEFVNGIRILDRMKKHQFIKFELWISCGVGAYKKESKDFIQNNKIVLEIIDSIHKIINRTADISIHSIIRKEHFITSKVN
jgi:hypothetical protein